MKILRDMLSFMKSIQIELANKRSIILMFEVLWKQLINQFLFLNNYKPIILLIPFYDWGVFLGLTYLCDTYKIARSLEIKKGISCFR